MENSPTGLMILSGGMDSATALAVWIHECESLPKPRRAVNFAYGQEALKRERPAARAIAKYFGLEWVHKIDLPLIRGSQLTNVSWSNRIPIPGGNVGTYVPMRNLILIAHAASLGYILSAYTIGVGVHATDAPYPDCSRDFLFAVQAALTYGSGVNFRLYAPLLDMSKADIVRKGLKLGVPFELTWTCYRGGEVACGQCPACKVRLAAFAEIGATDPIEYAE